VKKDAGIQLIWTFRRPCDQLLEGDVYTQRCDKSVKQMFWAGFAENIRTGLIPLDKDLNSARGEVTGEIIGHLYRAWLPELIRAGDIFMHDSASVHRAAIVKAILQELAIEVIN
jgi:hypothetical protein